MGGRVIVDPRPMLCEIFLMHHEKISENVLDSQDSCCPRSGSGTGTATDGGASPLGSARRSRDAAQRFRDELS